jgi:hypothetical protein
VIQGYYDLRIALYGVKIHAVARKTHCILPQEQHRTSKDMVGFMVAN